MEEIREKLTWNDLDDLGITPYRVRSRFKDLYGREPDGIAINNSNRFSGVDPPTTQRCGNYAYKYLDCDLMDFEEPIIQTGGDGAIIANDVVRNYGNSKVTMEVQLSGQSTNTTSVTTTISRGITFSNKIKLEGVFEFGFDYDINVSVGGSESYSFSKTHSQKVTVKVPPRSKVKVSMVGVFKKARLNFSCPYRVSGYIGANFPKRVRGHYFWFNPLNNFISNTKGTFKGTIKGTQYGEIRTRIHPAKSL